MTVTVSIPTPLRIYTENKKNIQVEGSSIDVVLTNLVNMFPKLQDNLFEEGKLRTFVNIYLNQSDVRYLDEKITSNLNDNDKISIIPSIAGGMK